MRNADASPWRSEVGASHPSVAAWLARSEPRIAFCGKSAQQFDNTILLMLNRITFIA